MPSSYPGGLDSSFPGYPYVDNTEYILSAFADAWVAAIQAIESTIGYGSGSVAANPLFSTTYPGQSPFSTITARIAYIESVLANTVGLDESAADIQPVGATAAAGGSGFGADAKHVHVGVRSFNSRSGAVSLQVSDLNTLFSQQGQLVVGTGSNASALLPIGASGTILTVGTGNTTGLVWATPSAAGAFTSGDMKFTTAFVVQTGWLAANGQAVSRTTYASLLAATTLAFTGTASGTTISGISSAQTAYMAIGMIIEGPGLGSSTTITGVSLTSITVSNTPTGGSQTFTVFPNGNGDGASTFNVVNASGRMPVGISGSGANNSPTYYMGQTGGEQLHSLAEGEGPAHSHGGGTGSENQFHSHAFNTGTESAAHDHVIPLDVTIWNIVSTLYANTGQPGGIPVQGQQNQLTASEGQTHIHTGTTVGEGSTHNHNIASDGSGTGHNNMPPYFAGQWLIKT